MRTIKFRAWNIQQNKMLYPASIDFRTYPNPSVVIMGKSPHFYTEVYPDDENILMQLTGLKDKNGKDIYEGDIVEFDKNGKGDIPYDGEHKIRRTTVYWSDFRASWSVSFSELANDNLYKYHSTCIVIGNIYER